MSEASNLTPTVGPNDGEGRRDSVASAKSAASVYSIGPEKSIEPEKTNEGVKGVKEDAEDEVCYVSPPPPPLPPPPYLPTLPQICPNLGCIVLSLLLNENLFLFLSCLLPYFCTDFNLLSLLIFHFSFPHLLGLSS